MNNLPDIFAFGLSKGELRSGIESILAREGFTVLPPDKGEAVRRMILESVARQHFMRRVEAIPYAKLGKNNDAIRIALTVAESIARNANLTPANEMIVERSVEWLAGKAGMSPATFKIRLELFANLGLIDYYPGAGNGRPSRIVHKFRITDFDDITENAVKLLNEHLDRMNSRLLYA